LRRNRDFCDFPDGGCRHLEFSEILNFNGLSAVGGQYASSGQISSKSVERLRRYGDLTVLKNGGAPPSWICEIRIFLMVCAVKGHILHQLTKFHKDRSNRYRDIAIFVLFNMAAAAIVNFQKFEIIIIIACVTCMR